MKKSSLNKNKGQSTIEMLMALSLSLGFLFIFVGLGFNFGTGYLVHYATFMASRVYYTADHSSGSSSDVLSVAAGEAKNTFNKYKVSNWVNLQDFVIRSPANVKLELSGALTKFTRKMAPGGPIGSDVVLELQSQSYLGKEPSRSECFDRVLAVMGGDIGEEEATLFDNGC